MSARSTIQAAHMNRFDLWVTNQELKLWFRTVRKSNILRLIQAYKMVPWTKSNQMLSCLVAKQAFQREIKLMATALKDHRAKKNKTKRRCFN